MLLAVVVVAVAVVASFFRSILNVQGVFIYVLNLNECETRCENLPEIIERDKKRRSKNKHTHMHNTHAYKSHINKSRIERHKQSSNISRIMTK